MKLIERLKAWWYVPTIAQMQADMLRAVWTFHIYSKMSRFMRVGESRSQLNYDIRRRYTDGGDMFK